MPPCAAASVKRVVHRRLTWRAARRPVPAAPRDLHDELLWTKRQQPRGALLALAERVAAEGLEGRSAMDVAMVATVAPAVRAVPLLPLVKRWLVGGAPRAVPPKAAAMLATAFKRAKVHDKPVWQCIGDAVVAHKATYVKLQHAMEVFAACAAMQAAHHGMLTRFAGHAGALEFFKDMVVMLDAYSAAGRLDDVGGAVVGRAAALLKQYVTVELEESVAVLRRVVQYRLPHEAYVAALRAHLIRRNRRGLLPPFAQWNAAFYELLDLLAPLGDDLVWLCDINDAALLAVCTRSRVARARQISSLDSAGLAQLIVAYAKVRHPHPRRTPLIAAQLFTQKLRTRWPTPSRSAADGQGQAAAVLGAMARAAVWVEELHPRQRRGGARAGLRKLRTSDISTSDITLQLVGYFEHAGAGGLAAHRLGQVLASLAALLHTRDAAAATALTPWLTVLPREAARPGTIGHARSRGAAVEAPLPCESRRAPPLEDVWECLIHAFTRHGQSGGADACGRRSAGVLPAAAQERSAGRFAAVHDQMLGAEDGDLDSHYTALPRHRVARVAASVRAEDVAAARRAGRLTSAAARAALWGWAYWRLPPSPTSAALADAAAAGAAARVSADEAVQLAYGLHRAAPGHAACAAAAAGLVARAHEVAPQFMAYAAQCPGPEALHERLADAACARVWTDCELVLCGAPLLAALARAPPPNAARVTDAIARPLQALMDSGLAPAHPLTMRALARWGAVC